jgi:hypothetical protein
MFYYKSLKRKIPAVFKIIASYSRSYFVISSKKKKTARQHDSKTLKLFKAKTTLFYLSHGTNYTNNKSKHFTLSSPTYVMTKRVTELTVFLMPQYSWFDTANEWIKVTKTLSSVV